MGYYMKRADAYMEMKMYDDCIEDCDAARILFPSNVYIYLTSASALLEKGDHEEAMKMVETAKKIDKKSTLP